MYVTLTETVGYVPGGTNVGIVRHADGTVTLIDSGLNDTTARKVLRAVREALGSEVVSIINTHGHADHFGANAFVHKRTSCEVWAPAIEATAIAHPILQPALLYGGAAPMDALRNTFLLAEAGPLTGEIPHGRWQHHGTPIDVIPLPGHSPNQVGFVIDGVFFCADVVFPEAAIEKYRIPYLFGLTEHLASLTTAGQVQATVVVPGHGDRIDSISSLVERNRLAIDQVLTGIRTVLTQPHSGDDVAAALFTLLDVPVTDAQSYYLLRPTVAAYLAHLERQGEVKLTVRDGAAMWSLEKVRADDDSPVRDVPFACRETVE